MSSWLAHVVWDADPTMFSPFGFDIRWYGLMFATAFLSSYVVLNYAFRKFEGVPVEQLDRLVIYVMAGTVVGARLAHIVFYHPYDYFIAPYEAWQAYLSGGPAPPGAPTSFLDWLWTTFVGLINLRQGGLASHGGAAGILVAIFLFFRRKDTVVPFLWTADRVAMVSALGGMFVRLGNLMNSEICGLPTGGDWGFVFANARGSDCGGPAPRHPAQLYEAGAYLLIFLVLWYVYTRRKSFTPRGLLLGLFLILVFGARFVIEFVKVAQEDYVNNLPLNTGQLLSIPFVLAGVWIVRRALKNGPPASGPVKEPEPAPAKS